MSVLLSRAAILRHLQHSAVLTVFHSKPSKIYVGFSVLTDAPEHDVLDGPRRLVSLLIELRRDGRIPAHLELIPPVAPQRKALHQARAAVLALSQPTPSKPPRFHRLLNFNQLLPQGPPQTPQEVLRLISEIEREVRALFSTGQPTRRWPNQRNRIRDWRQVFALHQPLSAVSPLQQPVPRPAARHSAPEKPVGDSDHHRRASEPGIARVLFLGSEFNAARGDLRSMNTMVHEYLRTGKNPNHRYFSVLRAQLRSLGVREAELFFDDVSCVHAGGKQTEKAQYAESVRRSVDHHRALLKRFRPDLIVIGGVQAFTQYTSQVLGGESQTGPVVLRLKNPSPEAHRGPTPRWVAAYAERSLQSMLASARRIHPRHRFFELIAASPIAAWRLQPC
ncbi:MAG: hypothetical protein P8R54_32500 [Myxococcota bacterium]|nr:hypothetical protein [Myxococcota bacterium]